MGILILAESFGDFPLSPTLLVTQGLQQLQLRSPCPSELFWLQTLLSQSYSGTLGRCASWLVSRVAQDSSHFEASQYLPILTARVTTLRLLWPGAFTAFTPSGP